MGGKTKEMKGRLEKAAGELTGNDRKKAEGEKDKFLGKAQQGVEKLRKDAQGDTY